jgi:hypothetical protein
MDNQVRMHELMPLEATRRVNRIITYCFIIDSSRKERAREE